MLTFGRGDARSNGVADAVPATMRPTWRRGRSGSPSCRFRRT
ncbi:MAG: hypothetical protein WKG07_13680 [Hymenobacter sp.]